MCLIVYSPTGQLLDRDVFDYAQSVNSDGIGIMSRSGVEKFVGRRHRKRAWRHLRIVAASGEPYGLHFRWRTHGEINRANTHPFRAPESDAYVMHNGIIGLTANVAAASEEDVSDTALFVRDYMIGAPDQAHADYAGFYRTVGHMIGYENKLLVMHSQTGAFTICNANSGLWLKGMWFSNDYSLPEHLTGKKSYWQYEEDYGGYGRNSMATTGTGGGHPFGSAAYMADLCEWPGRSGYRTGGDGKVYRDVSGNVLITANRQTVGTLANGRAEYKIKYEVNSEGTAKAILTPEEDEYADRKVQDCVVRQRSDDDYYRAVAEAHADKMFDEGFCPAGYTGEDECGEEADDEEVRAQLAFEDAHRHEMDEMNALSDEDRYRLTLMRMAARQREVA